MAVTSQNLTIQGRDGELRIYDANSHYIKIRFEQMDLQGPLARARPIDPIVPTVGGYVHAPTGPDYDEQLYAPQQVEFSFLVNTGEWEKVRDALCNPTLQQPWQVGADTWSTTKGRGSIVLGDGSFYATQPFDDVMKVTVDLQSLWRSPVSGSVFGMRWDEAYTAPQNLMIQETPDATAIRITALIYGNIEAISSFSPGSPS
jgi:hypothetical protein